MSQMSNWARHVGGPLASQQAGVSMVLSRSFASKSKSKAEPSEDKTETSTAPPKFKYTPASYYPFPKEKADYVIAEYTKDAHEESALVKDYIGSRLLYITDPVLREEIRAREAESLVKEEAILKGHQAVIESDMDATKKVHELIKRGAPSDMILNTMYNSFPRTTPGKRDKPNLELLDWKGNSRARLMDEMDMNGYDVEDSSDPDTLPRQRPFTTDEMNRILQDVEESNNIETDVEEHLFAPLDLAAEMARLKDSIELREKFIEFVRYAPPDVKLDQLSLQDMLQFKPPKRQDKTNVMEDDQFTEENTFQLEDRLVDYPVNKLANMIFNDAEAWTQEREENFGAPRDIGLNSGQQSVEGILKHSFHTNPGAGLIPSMTDFTTLPFEKRDIAEAEEEAHDPYLDTVYPFAFRVDELVLKYLESVDPSIAANRALKKKLHDVSVESDAEQSAFVDAEEAVNTDPVDAAAKISGSADLLQDDPQFAEAVRYIFSGALETRIPEYMQSVSKAEQLEIMKPLFVAWAKIKRTLTKPLKSNESWDEDGNVVVDETKVANLQDDIFTGNPIDKETYSRIYGLYEDDPELGEIAKLRNRLSKDMFDPDYEFMGSADPYFEDFTPENSLTLSPEDMGTITKHILDNDPYREYYDEAPKGIERVEYTVEYAVNPDDFVKTSDTGFKSFRKQMLKANNIQYNHIISKADLKRLRKGLDKYSGVPKHLLDFLEVFHNRRTGDIVASNPAEVKLREKLHLERLAQPSAPLDAYGARPDDSADEAPGISTPITLDGKTTHAGVRHVQEHYKKHAYKNPIIKRIKQYKVALVTERDNNTKIEDLSETSSGEELDMAGMSELENEYKRIKDSIILNYSGKGDEPSETEPEDIEMHHNFVRDSEELHKKLATMPTDVIMNYVQHGILPSGMLKELSLGAETVQELRLREDDVAEESDADPELAELSDDTEDNTIPNFHPLLNKHEDVDGPMTHDDLVVAAMLVREREMIRALTSKLQIRSRSDRAALRRIFSIAPAYARELINRAIDISNGILPASQLAHEDMAFAPMTGVNWQKELANLEARMMGHINVMNAKTGGIFPGVPAVNREDNGVFNPPELLTGEFAPLFVDSNLVSSGDELLSPSLRLPGYANAPFPCVATTRFQSVKAPLKVRDNVLNSVPHVSESAAKLLQSSFADVRAEMENVVHLFKPGTLIQGDLPEELELWENSLDSTDSEFLSAYRQMILNPNRVYLDRVEDDIEIGNADRSEGEYLSESEVEAEQSDNPDVEAVQSKPVADSARGEVAVAESNSAAQEITAVDNERYTNATRYVRALLAFVRKPTQQTFADLEAARKEIPVADHIQPGSPVFQQVYRQYFRTANSYLLDEQGNLIKASQASPVDIQNILANGAVALDKNGVLPQGQQKYESLKAAGEQFILANTGNEDITLTGYYNEKHGFIPVAYTLGAEVQYGDGKVAREHLVDNTFDHGRDFDPLFVGPSGYPAPPYDAIGIRRALEIYGNEPIEYLPTYTRMTDDPEYNFRHLMSDVDGKPKTNDNTKREKAFYNGIFLHQDEMFGSIGSDDTFKRGTIDALNRPEEDDLVRRLVDPTVTLSDLMSIRQYKALQSIYELRMAKNFFEGKLGPGDYAFMKNNYRLMDKAFDLDTFTDQESDLARLQKEMVVGVVREWVEDHDINHYRKEFDAHNLEPDYDPFHQHDDLLNAFAARRFSPYSTLPLGESNIPPLIGMEMQKHVYNLHLLDPVTFHPRWIARRLNLTYPAAVSMLKIMDMTHKGWVERNAFEHPDRSDYEEENGMEALLNEASPANKQFDSDIFTPHPVEQTLDVQHPEHLFSRFAPTLIGRISWTKNSEKTYGDLGWRHHQGPAVEMFGDQGMFDMYHYEQQMNRRWAAKEKILDAMEKAAFARWGPITWGNYKPGELHRPPKLPREIISTTLHPPTRHNWVLTTLDEAKSNVYAISVRDKDGYLRHPTYREFRNVRLREKDRRLPFYWRKYHVLGKLPEISNLFVDQVHALKKQMSDQYFPPQPRDVPYNEVVRQAMGENFEGDYEIENIWMNK